MVKAKKIRQQLRKLAAAKPKINEDQFMNIIRSHFKDDPHPWYGPCDGFKNGECAECAGSQSAYGAYFWMWLTDLMKDEGIIV